MEIPAAGKYRLWARAMPGSGLAYRLDGAKDAVEVAVNKGLDPIPISADANPFWPGQASWFDAGTVGTDPGQAHPHLVPGRPEEPGPLCRLGLLRAHDGQVRAQRQVQARRAVAAAGPRFRSGTGLGLSPRPESSTPPRCWISAALNEKTAGEHGFIKLSPDGDSFVRGDGQPMRFWAAGVRTGHATEAGSPAAPGAVPGQARRQRHSRIFAMLPPTGRGLEDHRRQRADLDSLFKPRRP